MASGFDREWEKLMDSCVEVQSSREAKHFFEEVESMCDEYGTSYSFFCLMMWAISRFVINIFLNFLLPRLVLRADVFSDSR